MKKIVKWVLISIGSLLALVILAAIIIPVVFKSDINKAIQKELQSSINADVSFDLDKFELSLIKNFPAITATLHDFGIINRAPFEGTILFAANEVEVEVNLMDLLFGNEMKVNGITLDNPTINILVNKEGKANYDITFPSTDTTTTEGSGEFNFKIDHWKVINGDIKYKDLTMPYFLSMKGFNHTGSGDFTQSVFDLRTHSEADSVTTSYDGVEYLTNKHAIADATISISEEFSKFTFKESTARVNDFVVSFDGWLKMNPANFDMDISFKSPDNSFKSLLSILPGLYTASFKDLEASGTLAFNGFVKGIYDETRLPAFNVTLGVKDGLFKYPSLPSPVSNIQLDLNLENKDGKVENTIVDLRKLHLDFAKNPFDASALISSFYPTKIKGSINASLNLGELTSMFPMEGMELKGLYTINVKADGVYDSLKKTIPAIDAQMALQNGFVKTTSFPLPVQDLHFNSSVKNSSGLMKETTIAVNDFTMLLDGEKFVANLLLTNLEDYTWDLNVKGGIDFEKITKIFPIDGMTLTGKAAVDLETKGKYSDLNAGKYDKLPTSGSASLKSFTYKSADLPLVSISNASLQFDPKKITLPSLAGTVGKSDFNMTGNVTNYLGFVMGNEDILGGTLTLKSNLFDLNELMPESEATTTTDTASLSVIPIPKNVNFNLQTDVKKVNLMNFVMTDAAGQILIHDGIADLKGITFNMLGGKFNVTGAYNTQDLAHPRYAFGLGIQNLSMKEAANASTIVQQYAPVAGLVNGSFNTDFTLSGELLQDMMPNLKTVNGSGLIKIAQASLQNSKLVAGITSLTKLQNTENVTLKDVLLSASIKDGRLSVKPFDVKFGDYKTTVSGSTGVDGSLDYTLKMDVPAGKLGTQFNQLVSSFTNTKQDPNKPIPLKIGVGGTFASPAPKLLMDDQAQQVKETATAAVKEEGTKLIQEAKKEAINKLLNPSKSDTVKTDTTAVAPSKQLQDAKNVLNSLLKKKKKN